VISRLRNSTPEGLFAAIVVVLLFLRVLALVFGHPNLGPDEGQYWFWSKSPDFGYYSKPPLIAWSILATTSLFGSAEWAVRLSAPFYHTGAALFLFLLCRKMCGARAGLYAGAAWLTLPGVFLSASLITTDAPLIFFWCAALYFYDQLTDEAEAPRRMKSALLLGGAVGLGFLSKYAMAYFALGAALSLIASPSHRRTVGALHLLIAAATAIAILAPNIWWNAANDFQTISHTAANANWKGGFGRPDRMFGFLAAQFGVVGPILLALVLASVRVAGRDRDLKTRETFRAMVAFAIPAILIVTVQSLISRAHANWAAVAYPSLVALAACFAARDRRADIAMKSSLALHAVLGAGFLAAFISAPFADFVGVSAAFKRLRGWDEIGAKVAAMSRPFDVIMTDDREVTGELVYYARDGRPIVAWNSNRKIDNHFEAFYPFDPARHKQALYVTERVDALYLNGEFASVVPLGEVSAATGPSRRKTLYLFVVADFSAR
jgi:hypothetical protein